MSKVSIDISNNKITTESYNSKDYIKKYYAERFKKWWFLNKLTEIDKNLDRIIDWLYRHTDLDDSDRELLLMRYINIIKRIEKKYRTQALYYTYSSIFTSTASLLVTALISINNLGSNIPAVASGLWWASWGLSLGISLINTIGSFYKWDRKYLLLFRVFSKLEQEIWMFLEQVGPYNNKNRNDNNNHKDKLNLFYTRMEFIHKRASENILDIEENEKEDSKDNISRVNKAETQSNYESPSPFKSISPGLSYDPPVLQNNKKSDLWNTVKKTIDDRDTPSVDESIVQLNKELAKRSAPIIAQSSNDDDTLYNENVIKTKDSRKINKDTKDKLNNDIDSVFEKKSKVKPETSLSVNKSIKENENPDINTDSKDKNSVKESEEENHFTE